jgi:uncharacterized protein (TIGR02145 family)
MKNVFTLLLAAACFTATAQLDDGSIAPDFIATDIYGNEHHLYSYLEQGKSVILCFMATWSGPDYGYHSSGVLQNVYEDYGPEGTDQLVVLLLESDDDTSLDDLYGEGNETQGNFVEGISYPIIDNAESIFWNYGNLYYPTIYAVCPDMTLVESGQSSYEEQVNLALDGCGYFAVGCTDPAACNYSSVAAADDGSCDYCFCGDGTTWVLSLGQCVPDGGSCGEGTVWDEDSQTCIIDETYCSWQPDSDGDQLIGVSDLLMFLSVFGDTDLDQDGIFDSNDDCVGEYDECGVCNGSGPSIPIVESIEILYDSVYAEQIDEWWVFEVGTDTTYSLICGYGCTDLEAENYDSSADTDDGSCLYPWACGDPLEYQGYDYETVQIGEQCWFAENLRSENYRNGDAIPTGLSDADWQAAEAGAVAIYQNDESYLTSYGRLYNWYAVNDARGLCSTGWHVPSDEEWTVLTSFLGGESEAGFKMKTTYGWNDAGNGSNESNFSGLPGGGRGNDGSYAGADFNGRWYSSTQNGNVAWNRDLIWDNDGVDRNASSHTGGFSIRCIKD